MATRLTHLRTRSPSMTPQVSKVILDTIKNQISPANPCTITITDAANRKYQLTVSKPVPWPLWNQPQGFDRTVVTSVYPKVGWNINEISNKEPRFDLLTEPPLP